MRTINALPALMDILPEARAKFCQYARAPIRRGARPPITSVPPYQSRGNWTLPVGMGRAISTAARVTFAEGRGSIVVFRDLVVAVQEIGRTAWLCPLTETEEGDLDADPADVVWRSGTALLTRRFVRRLERAQGSDPADRLLSSRIRDLQLAGLCGYVRAQRATFEGGLRPQDVEGADEPGDVAGRVVAHVLLRAGPRSRWRLRPDHPYRHLSFSWDWMTSTVYAEPPDLPSSAAMRARLRMEAAVRTLAWSVRTDAADELVEGVRAVLR